MSQSRRMSFVVTTTNVAVGYALANDTQIVMFPRFGMEAALENHLAIGHAFVGVSLARAYLLWRFFERLGKGLSAVDTSTHESPKGS